jgi:tellurite resistance-related uncharacterized protein
MQRIIIPTHYVHTRSTPLWTKETAPASIWRRHLDAGTRQGVYPSSLGDAGGDPLSRLCR